MSIEKLFSFLNRFFLYFTRKSKKTDCQKINLSEMSEEQSDEETPSTETEDKINVAKRTLMTKLYMLEQEIMLFENDFPEEYKAFMERINVLRENYNSSLEEIKKLLTFEIDPELDCGKNQEVVELEMDIKQFIEKEVKFYLISKRLQRLIAKLNILYNVSIFHSKENEKEKVISQLKRALDSAIKVACEFKECDYIQSETQLKERIVSLLSYVDYEIFKATIRNSNIIQLSELIEKLVLKVEFEGFDYSSAFNAFIKDEISDLGNLLLLINDDACRKILRYKQSSLLTKLTYSENSDNQIFDIAFWKEFMDFESSLLQILKLSGVEKDKVKVNLIERMNISIEEKDVLVLPITNAFLSLTILYSTTHDSKMLLLMKLLKNVSKEVTYKEIYFLLLLFDVIDVVKNSHNELFRHIEKYIKKYPYDRITIIKKKESLHNSSNKDYIVAFSINEYEEELFETLKTLDIDFIVYDNNVLFNSFYFNGLENVYTSLQNYTENLMI